MVRYTRNVEGNAREYREVPFMHESVKVASDRTDWRAIPTGGRRRASVRVNVVFP